MDTNQFVKNLKSAVKSAPKSLILPPRNFNYEYKTINILASEKVAKEIGIKMKKKELYVFQKNHNYDFSSYGLLLRFFREEEDLKKEAAKHFCV